MVRQMRRLAYVVVGSGVVGLAGCASRPAMVQAAAAPVQPGQSTPLASTGPVPAPPTSCSTWTVHVVRHEQTAEAASCQVAPIEIASDLTAQVRRVALGHVSVHFLEDRETATNVPPPSSLAGRNYVVPAPDATHDPRVESVAATVLDWPQVDPRTCPPR